MVKKFLFIFVILSFFIISSCDFNSSIAILDMELKNDSYYATVSKEEIDLSNYIKCSKEFFISYGDNEKVSSTEQLIFELENKENKFIIEYKEKNYTLVFIKEIICNLYILNVNNEILEEFLNIDKTTLNEEFVLNYTKDSDASVFSGEVLYSPDNKSWKKTKLGDVIYSENNYIIPLYEPKKYDLSFVVNDEIIYKTIAYGDEIVFPEVVSDENQRFIGWYANGNMIKEGSRYDSKMGLKFEAMFEAVEYTVIFECQGTKTLQTIKVGDPIKFPKHKDVVGYTFSGWYVGDLQINENDKYDISMGATIVAKYTVNQYKITYVIDDVSYEKIISYNSKIEIEDPIKEGYLFVGWLYNGELFTESIFNFTNDIIVYAKWQANTVELNLIAFGGDVNNIASIDENGEIELPKPSLEGYIFKYWCFDSSLRNKVESLNLSNYNGESLYAYYELENDFLLEQIVYTMYNTHSSNYDNIVLFEKGTSGMASKYWHKILIKNAGDYYYIANIGKNGDSLSSLGDYDFVLMAYGNCPYYSEFTQLDYNIGDIVTFLVDPTTLDKGSVSNMISISTIDYTLEYADVIEHLSKSYSDIESVSENVNLVSNFENYRINWESSDSSVISNIGIYHKPNFTKNVKLTAYINGIEIFNFTVRVEGANGENKALATGYIYTPYNTITQNAMNALDIIYCAFLDIDDNGDWTNLTSITNKINNYIKDKAEKAGTKIVISVNQSTNTAFGNVATSAILREKLANNIVAVIKDLNLDGVDIDWETPTSSQATSFTLLMKEIYEKVKAENQSYLVTAAIGGGMWQPPKYDLTNSIKYLDYVNLMTYSMTSANSYYQNALYPSTKVATLVSCSIDESVKIFNDLNVPNNKILVGIPFYVVVQTNALGPGSKTGSGGAKWYNVLETTYQISDTMKEYYDEECCVPYRYDAVNKIFISYDNERSIKDKCSYIHEKGLAGIMYWQYGQDVNDMLSNAIAKYIN